MLKKWYFPYSAFLLTCQWGAVVPPSIGYATAARCKRSRVLHVCDGLKLTKILQFVFCIDGQELAPLTAIPLIEKIIFANANPITQIFC